uniref:ST8 alpha-N-acetyl-neuraminide alpha-2,8-sialyltransferase 6 n=1 Tax=Terrapene triunguis TaxID=2587831 RepID=A0A674JHW9_9SAUR
MHFSLLNFILLLLLQFTRSPRSSCRISRSLSVLAIPPSFVSSAPHPRDGCISAPGEGYFINSLPGPTPEVAASQCWEGGPVWERPPPPQGSPFQGAPYDSCAVVGNGGILHNSGCGPEIDRAQFVIRFNLPPMGFSEHVGTKSSVITVNPSILVLRYRRGGGEFRGLSRWRRPFVEAMGTYGAPLLLIPAFSFIGFTAVSSQALYTLEDFGSLARAVFMNPEYLAGLDGHWHRRGLRAKRLSSGFMLVNAALELCQHLTLYGFWPFPTDPEGRPLSHHYYDNQPSKPGVHAMPDEFTRYLGMHLQGALRLHLGRCQEGPFIKVKVFVGLV